MNKYIPKMYKKSIHEVNYNKLKEMGIKCLIFDLDNTILEIDKFVPE
jgi:predicted HAD superfamily phosphohydrolase YqeG